MSSNDTDNFKSYDQIKSFTNSGLTRTKTNNKMKKNDHEKTIDYYKLDSKEVQYRISEYKDIMKEVYELREENVQLREENGQFKVTRELYEETIKEFQMMIENIQSKHKEEIHSLTQSIENLQNKVQNEYGSLEEEIENCVKVMKLDRKLIIENAVNAIKTLLAQNNSSVESQPKSFVENIGESFYNTETDYENQNCNQIEVANFNQNTFVEKRSENQDHQNTHQFYKTQQVNRSRKQL